MNSHHNQLNLTGRTDCDSEPRKHCAFSLVRWVFLAAAAVSLMCGRVSAAPLFNTDAPITFFTNVASRLLSSEMNLDLNHIQIYPANQYTPAVHRLLQVTANIYDATTTNFFPTVFRPIFSSDDTGSKLFITGYEKVQPVSGLDDPQLATPVDAASLLENQIPFTGVATNVYGIPWILGVKKHLPNFDQFAMRNMAQVTRKLEFSRPAVGLPVNQTNELFVLGITNRLGFSFWNSYSNDYAPHSGQVTVFLHDTLSMTLTNEHGVWSNFYGAPVEKQFYFVTNMAVWPGAAWIGYPPQDFVGATDSFVTDAWDFAFLPTSVYRMSEAGFIPDSVLAETNHEALTPFPRFGLMTTNRIQAFILDGSNVMDYVQLSGPDSQRNLSVEIQTTDTRDLWCSNVYRAQYGNAVPSYGVLNQIEISCTGQNIPVPNSWRPSSNFPAGPIAAQVSYFRDWFLSPYPNGNTNLTMIAPYVPQRTTFEYTVFQANDPLVHYLMSDLDVVNPGIYGIHRIDDMTAIPLPDLALSSPGRRYQPWGKNSQMASVPNVDSSPYNSSFRDPLVWKSDDWNFPTGQSWNLSWLGRVHRGTPWQTIYLKSSNVLTEASALTADAVNMGTNTWQVWTGDMDAHDARLASPVQDWHLVGLLAAMLDTNDLASQFSVNNLSADAWLNLMDGFDVLSNSSPYPPFVMMYFPSQFDALTISSNSPQAQFIANAIQSAHAAGAFRQLGDVLAAPELSDESPYLNRTTSQLDFGISDEAYEAIPSQLLPLLRSDSFGSLLSSNGQMQVQFSGYDGHSYAVQASHDLVHWIAVSTNSPENGAFEIPVSLEQDASQQFYRSVLLK